MLSSPDTINQTLAVMYKYRTLISYLLIKVAWSTIKLVGFAKLNKMLTLFKENLEIF